jgi:hypothetical protein
MQTWTYWTDSGELYAQSGNLFGTCYSGNGAGLNNPAMESVHKIGPLPAGYYQFGKFFDDLPPTPPDGLDHKGPHVCHLISVETDGKGGWKPCDPPYNRLGLMEHGDNKFADHSASEGCLIAARFIREATKTGDLLHVTYTGSTV